MNRQIKFRGKHISSGKWVFGDLIHGVGCHYGNSYILPNQQWLPTDCDPLDGYRVNPDSVGQFTGITDINGTEIYEDDALKVTQIRPKDSAPEDRGICLVKFSPWYGWNLGTDKVRYVVEGKTKLGPIDKIEVIGNIHDNSELLKGGDYGRNI